MWEKCKIRGRCLGKLLFDKRCDACLCFLALTFSLFLSLSLSLCVCLGMCHSPLGTTRGLKMQNFPSFIPSCQYIKDGESQNNIVNYRVLICCVAMFVLFVLRRPVFVAYERTLLLLLLLLFPLHARYS